MEDTLKQLSDFQIQALRKGISFDIDLYINDKKIPSTKVRMQYSVTGDISKGYAFDTTFSDNISKSKVQHKLSSIQHFISTVTGPIDED